MVGRWEAAGLRKLVAHDVSEGPSLGAEGVGPDALSKPASHAALMLTCLYGPANMPAPSRTQAVRIRAVFQIATRTSQLVEGARQNQFLDDVPTGAEALVSPSTDEFDSLLDVVLPQRSLPATPVVLRLPRNILAPLGVHTGDYVAQGVHVWLCSVDCARRLLRLQPTVALLAQEAGLASLERVHPARPDHDLQAHHRHEKREERWKQLRAHVVQEWFWVTTAAFEPKLTTDQQE